ncbi:MAG: hypothetical protein K2H81_07170 [Alistipes sp.]|nr:hypothetical protein [Alistipes sp.]
MFEFPTVFLRGRRFCKAAAAELCRADPDGAAAALLPAGEKSPAGTLRVFCGAGKYFYTKKLLS